jgi:hypothetical protein
MNTKAVEDMTLKELHNESIGLTDDLGEIINQLDMGLYNTVENPESRISLEKEFIEKTDRKELIDDAILRHNNLTVSFPPTANVDNLTIQDLEE